ncbi:MAG TPA: PAS domain S-box protein, partial [Syntrophorhabdus sp.]|nr:PAS domain S-box protein [Syntrophorhabdus sp.]
MKKTTKDNNQIQAKNSEHIQEILSQNLNIYRLIAENMYDAIYTLDTNVNFTFVNDVALKRSGYTRKWFIGRSFLNFVIPENKNMVQKSFKSVMMGKVVPAYE